jgi:uncharacterized protein with HEPN domain
MSDKDLANLMAILDCCLRINKFLENIWDADAFYADQKTFDAVLMNFIVIGESVSRLTFELREQQQHIPWVKIKDFRNIVAHDYFGVDAEEVWQTLNDYLPVLEKEIKKLLNIDDVIA